MMYIYPYIYIYIVYIYIYITSLHNRLCMQEIARVYMDSHLVVLLSTLIPLVSGFFTNSIPFCPLSKGSSSLVFPSDASWAVSLIMDHWVPTTKQESAPPGGLKGWKWNLWIPTIKGMDVGQKPANRICLPKTIREVSFWSRTRKKNSSMKWMIEWWWCYIFNITPMMLHIQYCPHPSPRMPSSPAWHYICKNRGIKWIQRVQSKNREVDIKRGHWDPINGPHMKVVFLVGWFL